MSRLLFILFLCAVQSSAIACSCEGYSSFVSTSRYSSIVALVEVLEHKEVATDYDNSRTWSVAIVEIKEVIKGKITATGTRHMLFGGDGASCAMYANALVIGSQYVLVLAELDMPDTNNPNQFTKRLTIENACGATALLFEPQKQRANGYITSGRWFKKIYYTRSIIGRRRMSYATLKRKILQ
jgi:hypothetical protein